MFAELVINIEASLEGTFHYHVPTDLQSDLQIGQLVEVEFGRRLAQGVIIDLADQAPVEETKPLITLINDKPVVWPWQIELAKWLSGNYLTPLNNCLRLMLPPGLTRWSDTTVDINPYWDGNGRLTELQQQIIALLQQKGDLRGRQIRRALPGTNWKMAVNQLVKRQILRRASVLDPPRIRPKKVRKVELIAAPHRLQKAVLSLGRRNKQAELLTYLVELDDPLPEVKSLLNQTRAKLTHLNALVDRKMISLIPRQTYVVPTAKTNKVPAEYADFFKRLPIIFSAIEELTPSPIPLAELQSQNLIQLVEQPAKISLIKSEADVVAEIIRLRGTKIYQRILTSLIEAAQPISVSSIYAATGANLNHLRKLVKLDLLRLLDEEVWRDPLIDRDFVPSKAPPLTNDQELVWERVRSSMIRTRELRRRSNAKKYIGDMDDQPMSKASAPVRALTPYLLHGVTGSGKTEIYMRAIAKALEEGQQAIVLVPEIALTPQTVRRFAARFPGRVAVLHSRLTDGERYDTWRRARQGLFDIVVGPRSALFSPLPNLGVIIIDEEHDPSYKQTPPVPPPYYHARQTAIALGRLTGAVIIMGSATPDVVVYHQARSGRYKLLELPKRVMGHRQRIESQAQRLNIGLNRVVARHQLRSDDPDEALTIPLPPIQVVDLRQELRAGNRSIFSRALDQAITETVARNEQAILFLNRRGSATFVICRDCGYVETCPRCDMPLTYHRPGLMLVCHHCGRREAPHQSCPQCGSQRIRYFGLGTEAVEEQVQQRWPEARITRWDRDTTAGRNTHETLLASFINQEADILVGTQMIAKGLDLPLVTLVGVISADVSLGLPDYRTGERAFQILAQVAGRAGRGLLGGRVIIQTYKPDHYAIQTAADHDYASFYLEEIRFRTRHSLPPFRRLAKLLYIDPINDRGQQMAERLAKGLRVHIREKALAATEILGPVPPFFNRIGGRYRWQIIIRSPNPVRLLADFPIPDKWMVDIDPVSTL